MAIEAIKRFFGRSPETENPELLTTADKVKRLLKELDLDKIGYRVDYYGPYALMPYTTDVGRPQLLIIGDADDTPEDRAQISARVDELKFNPVYKYLIVKGVEPRELMAILVTQGLYRGFHDKMGFAVMRFTGVLDMFDRPSAKKIDDKLKKAGFKNIGKDID